MASSLEVTHRPPLVLLAATSFEDRDSKMNTLGNEIEQDLELVGVTAIEDKLQVMCTWCYALYSQSLLSVSPSIK